LTLEKSLSLPDKFNPLYDEITAFFRSLCGDLPLKNTEISVLVGVSGGADSVALLHLLSYLKDRLNISRLGAAHVNHGLRGDESDGDERFVSELAECLSVEFFSVRLDPSLTTGEQNSPIRVDSDDLAVSDDNILLTDDLINNGHNSNHPAARRASIKKDGVEHWARVERYNFFKDVKQQHGFDYITTAHTAGDQAETLILRLMRGTGVRGLRGILPVRGDGVIRPLLGVERGILEKWLESRGLKYRTDSSNFDTKFRRNFVRAEIIPKMLENNAGAIANIAACAESAGRVWEIVRQKIDSWTNDYVLRVSESIFHIEKAGFDDALIAAEALVTLFDEYGIAASRLHIDRVMRSKPLSSGEHLLPGGWKFYPTDDRICFVKR
jgi:tRNA(Ile)-lysidine synthase